MWTRLVELLPNKILKNNFQGYGITTFPTGYVDESTVITVDSSYHTSVEASYAGPDQETSYKNKVFFENIFPNCEIEISHNKNFLLD